MVTLVHGTFAGAASWTRADSPMAATVRRALPGPAHLKRIDWPGRNNHASRLRGAQILKEHLQRCAHDYPHALQVVIAHSHGGNVVLYALRDPSTRGRVSAIISLGTPYLQVRERPRPPGGTLPYEVLGLVTAALVGVTMSVVLAQRLGFTSNWGPLGAEILIALLLIPLVWVAVVATRALLIARYPVLKDDFSWQAFRASFAFPDLEGLDGCVVRVSGDEASSALTASQFATWIVGWIYKVVLAPLWFGEQLRKPYRAADAWLESRSRRLWAALITLSVMSVVLIGMMQTTELFKVARTAGLIVFPLTFLLLFIVGRREGVIQPATEIGAGLVGLLALPLLLLIALTMLPFGLEAAVLSFVLDVTVEHSPPGEWTVWQMPARGGREGFWHSASHDDPRVLAILETWLRRWAAEAQLDASERALAVAVSTILSNPVFREWTKDPEMPKSLRDAGSFWGVGPGTAPSVVRARITGVDHTLAEARSLLSAKGVEELVASRHGRALFGRTDVERATAFQATLKQRFEEALARLEVPPA